MTLDASIKVTLAFRIAYPRAFAEAVLMLRPGPLAERNMLTEISVKNVISVVSRDKETREMRPRNDSVRISSLTCPSL